MIGEGTVVTKDVPDYTLVIGTPGGVVGWVSEAVKKLKFDSEGKAFCERSGKNYQLKNDNVISD